MTEPVALYRRVLDHFSDLVDSIRADQWTAATPCEGWTVRDLIEHVIVRDERLAATVGGPPTQPIPPDADLTARWHDRVHWWADALADPHRRDAVWDTPLGALTFAQATTALMTGELTIHTWDLARALRADETLDPEAVHTTLAQMRQHGEQLRQPGALGPELDPAPDSDEQTRLLAFTGRHVRPDTSTAAGTPHRPLRQSSEATP